MTLLADTERDALAELLGRHYVDGRLEANALQARVETVYRAQSREEAQAALADLPEPAAAGPARTAPRRRLWGRRHGEGETAQAGRRPTPERFRAPTTERVMRVWIDPGDGSRHYIPESRA